MALVVSALYRYPVKSCRGEPLTVAPLDQRGIVGDRTFMVVDSTGEFLTQRELPRLCLIAPTVRESTLTLSAPGQDPLTVPIRRAGEERLVLVWNDWCRAVDQGDAVAGWLERFLEMPARLVRLADDFIRLVDPRYARQPTDQVHFADAYPFLLIGQASLDDLNRRLETPLAMNRFRPNIVVSGSEPFAEDCWRRIQIGAVVFEVVKPCARCATTQVEQETARLGKEPLRTLARYRLTPDRKVLFGQNLIHHHPGTIRVGDAVTVLAAGEPPRLQVASAPRV
jgi:uncharacterized protein YcbX